LRFATLDECCFDVLYVVRVVEADNAPPVPLKARADVFGKSQACIALDRDVIVVVNPAEIIEAKMAGERCSF